MIGPIIRAGRESLAIIRSAMFGACRAIVIIEQTLARRGAEKLWSLLQAEPFINALGALTGNQALQLKAIYLSGWQVAKA